jgi:hypothetical protein
MSGAIIAIIKIKKNLYIFCKEKRKNTRDRAINTNGNLIPVITNKIIPYRNLKEVRRSYNINNQNPYFFIREKLPPGTIIHPETGYWTPWHT